jgi:hypothetical protein
MKIRYAMCTLLFAACASDQLDEDMFDEGPLDEDVASDVGDVEVDVPADELGEILAGGRPRFQLPFPCDQVWSGQTRTDHNPQASVDFNRADDFGDAVVAAAGGTVTRVDNEGDVSYGRWIEIAHGGGWRTRYAHLSAQGVSEGDHVKRGQRIGKVGSSGGSTGPHLHFEERHDGVAVKAVFNGTQALYFGTRSYRSHNCN